MSRIKGKYVATLEIDFDTPRIDGMKTTEEIKQYMTGEDIIEDLTEAISDEVMTVTLTTTYADVVELEDEQ